MSAHSGQNMNNHTRIDPKGTVVALLAVITVILGGVGCYNGNTTVLGLGVVFSGVTLFWLFITARLYGTCVQDRIIRMEMKIRLQEILDADLATRAEDLSLAQVIALRFASDAEMPGLVAKVLDGNITDLKEIKKLVTDWQGDYHRV